MTLSYSLGMKLKIKQRIINSLSRVRRKLMLVQLVKFRAVYGTRRSITVFPIMGQINSV